MNTYQSPEQFFQSKNIAYHIESNGKELRILCTFCSNLNQKCYVSSITGQFYCFHCGEGGNWKGLVERLGNPDATIPEQEISDKEDEPDLPPIDPEIIEQNHQRLFNPAQKPILEYLHNRLLTNETIIKYQLGWDGKYITIPIFDADEDCANFRLKRDPTLPSVSKGMVSISGRGRKRLFNEIVLKEKPESIIICEGEWDCMLLAQYGYSAVTTTGGAQSFDESWIDAFVGIEKIYICYDNDQNKAGQKGAVKTAQLFHNRGLTAYIVDIGKPEGTEHKIDVTDFFKKHGEKANNIFEKLLVNAKQYEPTEETQQSSKGTIAQRLVALVFNANCELYFDEFDEPHITLPESPIVAFPLKSSKFRRWLAAAFHNAEKRGFSSENFNQVINTLEGQVFAENIKRKLHNRIARVDDTIYYDLGNDKTVVRIDGNGWEVISKCSVRFRRFPHQHEQVEPLKGGDIHDLLQFINLHRKQDQLLFLTHTIVSFIPNIPRAAIANIGDKGAAKSTALRIMRQLIDPSKIDLLKLTNDTKDIILNANKHYCLYYDNLSYISSEISDTFSALITGIGLEVRRLYTNDESIIFIQKIALGFSAIPLVATKPDLLDRLLILQFNHLPENQRYTEEEFLQMFDPVKQKILGAIFDCLAKVLKIVHELHLPNKPRMADYAQYGAAAAISLGSSTEAFLFAYNENVIRQNQAAIESSPVAQIIIDFMQAQPDTWSGSTSELYTLLRPLAETNHLEIGGKDGFPKSSNKLWGAIRLVKTNLMSVGIIPTHSRTGAHSVITLSKIIKGVSTN